MKIEVNFRLAQTSERYGKNDAISIESTSPQHPR